MGSLLIKKNYTTGQYVLGMFILLIGLLMVGPFLFMISASFKLPGQVFSDPLRLIPANPTFANYQKLIDTPVYFRWIANTFFVAGVSIFFRFWVVSLAAYSFARLEFPGKNILFLLCLTTMMITPDTTIVPRYLIYRALGLYNTSWALTLPAAFDVFFLFLFRQSFKTIPKELTEAAQIDGCHHSVIYFRIILPLAVPSIITMVLFTFIWSWNDYINPFIFISSMEKQLISVGLQFFQGREGANLALQMAGASLAVIPTIVFFLFTQKFFIQGISRSGIKG